MSSPGTFLSQDIGIRHKSMPFTRHGCHRKEYKTSKRSPYLDHVTLSVQTKYLTSCSDSIQITSLVVPCLNMWNSITGCNRNNFDDGKTIRPKKVLTISSRIYI
jgi:hypothetical protein